MNGMPKKKKVKKKRTDDISEGKYTKLYPCIFSHL